MTTRDLNKHYLRGAVIPFAVIAIMGIILRVTHVQDPDYKSDFFPDDGYGETVFLFVSFSFLLMILSLTIFLNNYKIVFNNLLLSLASWLLLPLIFAFKVLPGHISTMKEYPTEINSMDYFLIAVFTIHLIALSVSFILFRIALNKLN